MGFEEIIIGKIKSPNEFYFVPVDEDHKVYNRQVREMKEFVNLKEKPETVISSTQNLSEDWYYQM